MKLGILGGTFNPIHNGHLALANTAVQTHNLDKILFIPTYIPPHKTDEEITSSEDRYNMVKLAIKSNNNFEASRLEINRRNISYSADTLIYIQKIYPKDTEIFFILGSDSAVGISEWKDIDKVLSICKFLVGIRPSHALETTQEGIEIMPMAPVEISSTQVRELINQGKEYKQMLPPEVAHYIEKSNLYR